MAVRKLLCVSLATIGVATSQAIQAESWNYQTYSISKGTAAAPGYLTLEESQGESRIKIVAPKMGTCWETDLKASVERTDQTIVITVVPRFATCEEIRFVIKTDGTGGIVQKKRGDAWVSEPDDRLLTIRK